MDLYASIRDCVAALPAAQAWPEFQALFDRILACRPRHWHLPLQACQAVGGGDEAALPAVAAIACAQIGIVLLDDLLDEDPRGEYHRLGPAIAANLASAFQLAGLEVLSRGPAHPAAKLRALESASRMLLTVTLGQELDIRGATSETEYWQIVQHKSASFFSEALHLGALLGGASELEAADIHRFGRLYGEMIQIHDDLSDTLASPAGPDWTQRRAPLPILFAQTVDHPDRQRFLKLFPDVARPETLREAQEILIRCGAVSYCLDQLLQRHQAAEAILSSAGLPDRQPLQDLADEVAAPVWTLLSAAGSQSLEAVLPNTLAGWAASPGSETGL